MKLLTRTFTTPKSPVPLVSVNVKANVCGVPDATAPRPGFRPVTAIDPDGVNGTPQVPSACHPEFNDDLSPAEVYTTLLPAKLAVNVIASVSVRLLPLPLTELPVPLIVHCPFEIEPLPGST